MTKEEVREVLNNVLRELIDIANWLDDEEQYRASATIDRTYDELLNIKTISLK